MLSALTVHTSVCNVVKHHTCNSVIVYKIQLFIVKCGRLLRGRWWAWKESRFGQTKQQRCSVLTCVKFVFLKNQLFTLDSVSVFLDSEGRTILSFFSIEDIGISLNKKQSVLWRSSRTTKPVLKTAVFVCFSTRLKALWRCRVCAEKTQTFNSSHNLCKPTLI